MSTAQPGQPAPAQSGAGSPRAGTSAEPRLGSLLGAGLGSALLFSAGLVVPFLLPLGMAAPFPLALQRLRAGLSGVLLSGALAAALLAAVFTPGQGVAYILFIGLPGLLIGEAMARGRGLLRGCAWAFLVLSAEISLALLMNGGRMAENSLQGIEYYRSPKFLGDLKASVERRRSKIRLAIESLGTPDGWRPRQPIIENHTMWRTPMSLLAAACYIPG
jgi:hypothetical protein